MLCGSGMSCEHYGSYFVVWSAVTLALIYWPCWLVCVAQGAWSVVVGWDVVVVCCVVAMALIYWHCWHVIVQGASWAEAEANAVALGGHLVTINNKEENDFIAKVIQSEPDLSFFIGATDKEIEGIWTDPSGNLLTYTNWNIGPNLASEPNGGTSENYGVIYPGNFPGTEQARGTWNDASNIEEITRGVAEIHLAPNNAPTGAPTLTGDFKVGQTISIDASAIEDVDNFEGWTPTYEYSWEVSGDNGTTWTALTSSDATDGDDSYIFTSAEVGKQLRGVVSYLDGYGSYEVVEAEGSVVTPVIRGNSL